MEDVVGFRCFVGPLRGVPGRVDPLLQVEQEEEALLQGAGALLDQGEALFADLLSPAGNLTPLALSERSLTVVADEEESAVVASLKASETPGTFAEVWGKPLNLTIRCSSRGQRRVYLGLPHGEDPQNARMLWVGGKEGGSRLQEEAPMTVEEWPGPPPNLKPAWSCNRLGLGGFWADGRLGATLAQTTLHLTYTLPTIAGEPLQGTLDLTRFAEALRAACCGLPKPYDVEWPPALLLREEAVLAFLPYKNPKLNTASSPEDLLGEPLGLAYLRLASGAKLTKADGARMVEVKLSREEPDWVLLAQDLRNPGETLVFRVGQVEWCDGCFGQDPPPGNPIPRRLAIEDRQGGAVFGLQVGKLLLRGIEKKDIR